VAGGAGPQARGHPEGAEEVRKEFTSLRKVRTSRGLVRPRPEELELVASARRVAALEDAVRSAREAGRISAEQIAELERQVRAARHRLDLETRD
jgi:hypothetical protein